MNYQEFLDYVEKNLAEVVNAYVNEHPQDLGYEDSDEVPSYTVRSHQITKNNGIVLDGVSIVCKKENASPNIYLNNFYSDYQMGKPLDHILQEILQYYLQARKEIVLNVKNMLSFEEIKDDLILRLVNYEMNKEQLQDCPHKIIADFAITFRYVADKTEQGLATALIYNKEFESWGIDLEDLYRIALENTIREFPSKVESLVDVVMEHYITFLPEEIQEQVITEMKEMKEIGYHIKMLVLTNDTGLNGASCILYPNVLKAIAESYNCNLYILPSSVHEVMLVPDDKDADVEALKDLVTEANEKAVGLIDLLSHNVHYYDREQDAVTIID